MNLDEVMAVCFYFQQNPESFNWCGRHSLHLHPLSVGGGALPAAITAGTTYFVKTVLNANTFTISATAGGTAINTATTGTDSFAIT